MRIIKPINITPALHDDVVDLARAAKEHQGSVQENLFSRAAIIMAVVALEHFINLYLETVRDLVTKRKLLARIERKKRDKNIRTSLAAKWYVVSDYYTPNRFLPNVPPFAELVELIQLRNQLVHPTQKKLKSRVRGEIPQLLAKTDCNRAEWASRVLKNVVAAFYQMAYKGPPDWISDRKPSTDRLG